MNTYENIDSEVVVENEYLMASLLETGSDVDASLGTVIRELAVRPNAVLAAHNDARLEAFRQEMTLSSAIKNPNVSDDSVDALSSNFRLVRSTGNHASGVLSIYTNQTSNVYIGGGSVFTAGGTQLIISRVYIGYVGDAPAEDTGEVAYRKMV